MFRRLVVLGFALLLLVPVSGCGGRLSDKLKDAAEEKARTEGQFQLVSFDETPGDRLLFRDDFEDGNLDDWKTTVPWSVKAEGDTQVLIATGSGQAAWVPEGAKWTDYYVRAGVKLSSGGVSMAFRMSTDGGYWLLYRTDGLFLIKEDPKGNYIPLTQTAAPALNAWHILSFGAYGGHLQAYVDQELQMDYVDGAPLTKGTIGIASMEDGHSLVDNVMAVKLLEDLPAPASGSSMPVTVVPPSAPALEEDWQSLEDWAPEEVLAPPSEGGQPAEDQGFSGGEGDAEGPPAGLPVIDYFYAEPVEGEPGCYYLQWDLHDADVASLNGQGVPAPGSSQVCDPGAYTLVAENAQGSVQEVVVIDPEPEQESDEPVSKPELFIGNLDTELTNPNNPKEVLFNIRVRNAGEEAAGAFAIRLYPHANQRDVVGCSINVDGLLPHETEWYECTYAYPQQGEMHFLAVVDEENEIDETDDTNNEHRGTVTVREAGPDGGQGQIEAGDKPDLHFRRTTLRYVDAQNPLSVEGEFVIHNFSTVDAGPFKVVWYPTGSSGVVACTKGFPQGLPADEEWTFSCRYVFSEAGEYTRVAMLDAENTVAESDETNNTSETTGYVGPTPSGEGGAEESAGVDLVIENSHFEPDPVGQGRPFSAVATVRNRGAEAAGEPFTVLWHFHEALGIEDCVATISGIGAGAAGEVTICERTTNANPGQAPTWVTIDTDNVIHESEETNNDESVTMRVAAVAQDHPDPVGAKPNLIVQDAHYEPAFVVPGEDFKAVVTILNDSEIDATEPFEAMWIFEDALRVDNCTWTYNVGLPAGMGGRTECTRNSPAPVHTNYYAEVTVDAQNVIAESDEIDNDQIVPLTLYAQDDPDPSGNVPAQEPDLVARNVAVRSTDNLLDAGGDAIVSFTVVNQGSGVAAPSKALWYAKNVTFWSDTCNVPELQPGRSHLCRLQFGAIPSSAGTYPHEVLVDSTAAVTESEEGNNKETGQLTIVGVAQDHPDPSGPADLVIRNLDIMPNPVGTGQDMLVEFDVVNQSSGSAPASVAQWKTPPGAGLSFTCDVPVLQAGGKSHCSRQFAAPMRKAGYKTTATADVNNTVNEGSAENNNAATLTLKVQ